MSEITREDRILTLRSAVITQNSELTTDMEVFQNDVLRPILKFQHTVLVALFNSDLQLQKQLERIGTEEEYTTILQNYITKEARFRSLLIGVIIGLFSQQDLEFYLLDKRSVSKRIVSMLIKRFVDTCYLKK